MAGIHLKSIMAPSVNEMSRALPHPDKFDWQGWHHDCCDPASYWTCWYGRKQGCAAPVLLTLGCVFWMPECCLKTGAALLSACSGLGE